VEGGDGQGAKGGKKPKQTGKKGGNSGKGEKVTSKSGEQKQDHGENVTCVVMDVTEGEGDSASSSAESKGEVAAGVVR